MVVYEGIDRFNRPVFKDENSNARYGSTRKLFNYCASEDEVLLHVTEADLILFGYSFGCEPLGDRLPSHVRIERSELQKLKKDKAELIKEYKELLDHVEGLYDNEADLGGCTHEDNFKEEREFIKRMENNA